MTKKTIINISTVALVALPIATALMPHVAHAGWFDDSFYTAFAFLTQGALALAGWFLSLAGVLLNGVMVATLNMKLIVDNTPAVGVAWRTIRDFSSIFIIFMLLYASIKMILGMNDHNLGTLIKNVIIAGLLINFSLFGTKLLIDASNIISTSFYCAMVPAGSTGNTNFCDGSVTGATSIASALTSSGIANVFMQSLDIQAVVSNGGTLVAGSDPHLSIALSNVGASILMAVAGISFITAAIMFAVRIGVLILLMAFSPIYFIAMIVPEIATYAKKWSGALYSMCIFMPVYLFLMYIAVKIINDPAFFNFARIPDTATNTGLLSAHTVGIFLQYMIAFIMVNAPLVAAITVASEGASVVSKMGEGIKKWGQGAIQGGASSAWKNTGGRAMSKISENERFRDFAAKNAVGEYAFKGVKGIAGSYEDKLKKQVESRTKFAEGLGYDRERGGRLENIKDRRERLLTVAQDELKTANRGVGGVIDPAAVAHWDTIVRSRKAKLENAEKEFKTEKNKRLTLSAKKAHGGSIDTLWMYSARKDKLAAAAIDIKLKEEDKKKEEERLKDKKSDIKKLDEASRKPGGLTQLQVTELAELEGKRIGHLKKIEELEADINDLKTIT